MASPSIRPSALKGPTGSHGMPRAATAASKLGVFDRALARTTEQQRQLILLIGLEGTSYRGGCDNPRRPGSERSARACHAVASRSHTLMDRGDGTGAASGVVITSVVPKRRRLVPPFRARVRAPIGWPIFVTRQRRVYQRPLLSRRGLTTYLRRFLDTRGRQPMP